MSQTNAPIEPFGDAPPEEPIPAMQQLLDNPFLLLFIGVLSLRSFAAGTERKASLTAVAAIVAYVDVPLVYFCVRWWRSLHQIQSSPATVDPAMVLPLRVNAFGLIFAATWFIVRRARLELARRRSSETAIPDRIEKIEVRHA
mgnify:CR=1 FL=1